MLSALRVDNDWRTWIGLRQIDLCQQGVRLQRREHQGHHFDDCDASRAVFQHDRAADAARSREAAHVER